MGLTIGLAGLGSGPLQAESGLENGSVEIYGSLAPTYQPDYDYFEPAEGTYTYDVTWQGIPAATVQIVVDRETEEIKISTRVRTAKAVDLFYRLRYRAEGTISAHDYSPISSIFDIREGSRTKYSEVKYLEDGSVHSLYRRNGKVEHDLTFKPTGNLLDPFAAAFLARSLNWQKGETKAFDTYNGRTHYLIELTASDLVSLRVNGELRPVWVITPTVRKLPETHNHEKLREARIYVTDDGGREIVQIISEVFIGSVRTKLAAFAPAAVDAPTTVAQRRDETVFVK